MIKDLSASLVAAAAAINQKSREAFVAEQKALEARKTVKMPMQPLPKADPAAVSTAKKMAEAVEGTVPKTPREKELAAKHGHPKRITFGDVLKARGVRKEETEQIDELSKDTMNLYKTAAVKSRSDNFELDHQAANTHKALRSGMAKTNTYTSGSTNSQTHKNPLHADSKVQGALKTASDAMDAYRKPLKQAIANRIKGLSRVHAREQNEAAYEEAVQEGMMDTMKKIGKKIVDTATHGSDEDLIKDLQKKTGVPQTGKKPVAEASGWNPIKHIPKEKQSDAIKTAAKDVKRGSYADRAALLKAGGVKEEKEESAAHEKAEKKSPFDTSGPSTAFDKEKSAFTSKKVSTGTVYSRKPVKESEEVQHEQFGLGKTLPGQEAEDGSWIDVMFAEGIKRVETKDLIEAAVGASHIHVSPAGGGKYKVHAVGSKFASGIKVGEHLTDTHLDDFAEMGGKIKHVKAEKKD